MRRWVQVAFAGLWLLGACSASQPERAPLDPARQPKTARGSFVTLPPSSQKSREIQAQPSQPHAVAPAPAASTSASSQQLAGRFGSTRALSVQLGSASYYSDAFAGRSTASGTPYEPHGFTAAHRTLPFGSVLRVTRSDGGQVVYVRVTDRGPYARGRIVDLSRAAAEQLGMMRAGVVKVKVEVVEYGPRKPKRRRR